MSELRFSTTWFGEKAAGIHPGSENVTIQFVHSDTIDQETIDYWKDCVETFFDGSKAVLIGVIGKRV